jgi:hypothetical protein
VVGQRNTSKQFFEDLTMKKIIAIAAIIASAQASAFMDSANTNAYGANNAKGDFLR